MKRLLFALLALLLVALAACAQPAAAPAPAAPAAPTAAAKQEAPKAEAPKPTEAPKAAEAPKPTEAPKAAAPAAPAANQKPVVILEGVDATTLDPQKTGSLPEASLMGHLMCGLTQYDKTGKLMPYLATEWKTLEDKKVWQFKLNPKATFSDGKPVTGEDVKYTVERASNPDSKIVGNTLYLLNNLRIDKVDVVDPQTVNITTKVPSPVVPSFLSELWVIPKAYYSSLSLDDAAKKPVGCGPYTLKEWIKDDHITIEARKDWWFDPKPTIQTMVWRPVPDAATRLNELLAGNADLIENVPPDRKDQINNSGVADFKSVQTGRRIFVGITTYNNPLLLDKKVRQAMNYAFNFDAVNKAILASTGKRSGVTVNPPWNNDKVQPYTYDPAKAGQLLDEAGWKLNPSTKIREKDGQPLKVTFESPNGRYIKDLDIAQAIAQNLKDVGFDIDLKPMEWSQYVAKLNEKKMGDIYLIGSGSNFEGQADLSDLEANSSSNYANWKNDKFQELFEQLRPEFDNAKRKAIMDQMQELVKDEAPYIFIYMQPLNFGTSKRLANWEPYANERVYLWNTSLK